MIGPRPRRLGSGGDDPRFLDYEIEIVAHPTGEAETALGERMSKAVEAIGRVGCRIQQTPPGADRGAPCSCASGDDDKKGKQMLKKLSRSLAAALGVAVAAATLVATPAQADQLACGPTQTKLISVPTKPYDISVWATVCVISSGTSREAAIKIEFDVRGIPSDNPFTLFRFGSRLEHRNSSRAVKTCDYTSRANDPRRHYGLICKSGRYSSPAIGNWTGDGYLEWEVIGDGLGHLFWQFPDSPAIS